MHLHRSACIFLFPLTILRLTFLGVKLWAAREPTTLEVGTPSLSSSSGTGLWDCLTEGCESYTHIHTHTHTHAHTQAEQRGKKQTG